MPWTYFVTRRGTGVVNVRRSTDVIPEAEVDTYFRIIAVFTGYDRRMAERILHSGRTIDHPSYIFSAREEK
jgi:hypothetical protein